MCIATLNLGKRSDTHQDIKLEVTDGHDGTTVLVVLGPPERVTRYLAERVLPDLRPPMMVVYVDHQESDGFLQRRYLRLGPLVNSYPSCPLVVVSQDASVMGLMRDHFQLTAIIHITDEGDITYHDGKNGRVPLL
jgi:hypothetical protein